MRNVTLEPIVTDNEPDEYLADTEDNIIQSSQQLASTTSAIQQQQQQNRHHQSSQYSPLIDAPTGHHHNNHHHHHHNHNHHIPSSSATSSSHHHHHSTSYGSTTTQATTRDDGARILPHMVPSNSNVYRGLSSMKSSDSLSINSDENSSPTTWSNESDFDADDDDDSNLFLAGSIMNKTNTTTRKRRHHLRNKKTHLSANQRTPSNSFTQSRQQPQPFAMFNNNHAVIEHTVHNTREPMVVDDDYNDDNDNENEILNESTARSPPTSRNSNLRVSRPSRIGRGNGQNLAENLCSRILDCPNLDEVIKFVETNRPIISQLTRIVTHEAPSFRNYDLTRYQIDYSVKESFNPNFWLDRNPIVTTADGNCQYHAVSISLTGTEEYTPHVRLATAVAVIDNRVWFDQMLRLIDRGTVHGLVKTISRSYAWGDETTLKAIAVAINRRIFLYSCNFGKKDFEIVRSLTLEELLDAFSTKKYCGGTAIHTYADPINPVAEDNYIMLFHKSEHFIAVLPSNQHPTTFQPFNPIVPMFV